MGGRKPLVTDEHNDEFGGNKGEAEHDGECDEAGEAEHLGKSAAKTLGVVSYCHEGGVCNTLHDACDGGGAHGVPLVGLGVSTYFNFGVEFSQHKGEYVIVDLVEDVGDEHLGGKGEHFPYGSYPCAGRFSPFGKREGGAPA